MIPQVGFIEACKRACKGIVTFKGRARRSEFWWAILATIILNIVVSPIGYMGIVGIVASYIISLAITLTTLSLTFRRLHDTNRSGWFAGVAVIITILIYVCIISSIAQSGISFRDLYEAPEIFAEEFAANAELSLSMIGVVLLSLLLCVYSIVLVVFCCFDSDPTDNKYGCSTKY